MKRCLYCDASMIKNNPRANNVKYCSTTHRTLHYAEQGRLAAAQRKYINKKHQHSFIGARQCFICQRWYRAVCHHAWQAHEIDERTYKMILGIDHKVGLIPEDLKELKAQYVKGNGTIKNLAKGATRRFVPGDPRAGRYQRSPQTIERLKQQFKHEKT